MKKAALFTLIIIFLTKALIAQTAKPEIIIQSSHTDKINCIKYSPDDKYIATAGNDGIIKLWESNTGLLVRNFAGHKGAVSSFVITPDGKKIISAGKTRILYINPYTREESKDSEIFIWDLLTGGIIRNLDGHNNSVLALAISQDGNYLASSGEDKKIIIWDLNTWNEINKFSLDSTESKAIVFTKEGKDIIVGCSDGDINSYNLKSGTLNWTIYSTSYINTIDLSPDGNILAVGNSDGGVLVYDINTSLLLGNAAETKGEKQIEIPEFEDDSIFVPFFISNKDNYDGGINSLVFTPDGKYIIFCDNKTINISDLSKLYIDWSSRKDKLPDEEYVSNEVVLIPMNPYKFKVPKSITSVCISKSGIFSTAHQNDFDRIYEEVKIKEMIMSLEYSDKFYNDYRVNQFSKNYFINWGLSGRNELSESKQDSYPLQAAYYSAEFDEIVFKKNLNEIKTFELSNYLQQHNSLLFTETPGDLYYNQYFIQSQKSNRNSKFNFISATKVKDCLEDELMHYDPSDLFSPEKNNKISNIYVYDYNSGNLIDSYNGHDGQPPLCFAYSENGNILLTGGRGNAIIVRDIKSKETYSIVGHHNAINAISFFKGNEKAVSVSADSTIIIWDLVNRCKEKTLSKLNSALLDIVIPDNCSYIITADNSGEIYMIDTAEGDILKKLVGHSDNINSLTLSRDDKFLLSSSNDKTIKLWDISEGKNLKTFTGHSASVISAEFHKSGNYVISWSRDNMIKLWDIRTGKELATIVLLNNDDWAVITSEGLFDASQDGMRNMHFTVNTPEGPEPIDLDQLKHRYYQPDLLPILLGYNKSDLRKVPEFDNIRLYPKLDLQLDSLKGKLNINLKNRGGGIGKVSVYIDNIELITDARENISEDSVREEMNIPVDLNKFSKKLNYGTKNTLKVIAFNSEGYLKSRPEEITYTPVSRDAKGDTIRLIPKTDVNTAKFWAVIVGTSNIGLKFAAKDALDFSNGVKIGADNLFGTDKVNIQLLTTDIQDENSQPTKINIKNSLDALKSSSPDDIVLIYFSGHGVTYNSEFYYLTLGASSTDNQYLSDPAIRENYTLSNNELTDIINGIPARKKVLIFDACASGKAVENIAYNTAREVPPDQKIAFEIMKDRTGLYLLAGCAADNVSYETSKYGQGLLTYSLLMGMRGAKLRSIENGEFIDVPLLFAHAEEQVPLLAMGIGGIQQPFYRCPDRTGTIIIGKLNAEDKNKIFLSEPKPVFMSSRINNTDLLGKDIKLEDLINKELSIITSKGTGAEMILIEAKGYPDAYQIKGMYTISGEEVEVNYILMKQDQPVTDKKTIKGKVNNISVIVQSIIKSVLEQIKK